MAEKGRYTKFSNKIGLYSNSKGGFIKNDTGVVINFPFKDAVLEGGMSKEDKSRDERFLHLELDSKDIDTLEEPKVLTDFRYIDKEGEKKLDTRSEIEFFDSEGNLQQNLLIKGNNLLALHTLREKLSGKVKLIYIDPPYNTGGDGFRYNDQFNHSAWLVFMKNRLEVAKKFLTDDGFIAVQCDDNEQAYLKVLMDEVYGRSNFISTICVKMSHLSGVKMSHINKKLPKIKEFILLYANNREEIELNPQYTKALWLEAFDRYGQMVVNKNAVHTEWEVQPIRQVAQSKGVNTNNQDEYEKFLITNASTIFRTARNDSLPKTGVRRKFSIVTSSKGLKKYVYNDEEVLFAIDKFKNIDGENVPANPLGDIWTDIGINNLHNEGGVDFQNGKKPEKLLKRLILMCTNENDIVLDYHLGSGTTAAVADRHNRRWVGIEQMDYIEELAKVRLKNEVSKDLEANHSFVYFELKKYNQEYIDRIMEATSLSELEVIYVEMRNNAFLKFWFDRNSFEKDEDFRKLDLDDRKEALADVLDENQLYLNYADMNDTRHNVSDEEKSLTDKFYGSK